MLYTVVNTIPSNQHFEPNRAFYKPILFRTVDTELKSLLTNSEYLFVNNVLTVFTVFALIIIKALSSNPENKECQISMIKRNTICIISW